MANVTYLIGAGASAQAIPTVGKKFNERFLEFISLLDVYAREKNEVKQFLLKVRTDLPKHYSVDTYARKMFFQNPNLYRTVKVLISYYLLLEQMTGYVHYGEYKKKSQRSDYSEVLDPRYDVLYAALLNEKTKKLPNDINFISWNYDSQFELSLAEFFGLSVYRIHDNLGVYPSTNGRSSVELNQAQLLKLNGTAGLYCKGNSDDSTNQYQFYVSPGHYFESNDLVECVNQIEYHLKYSNFATESLLHFSWEEKEEVTAARHRAKDVIENTRILIIVGYSFPVYNRKVDREILSKLQHAKVFLQVSREHIEAYTERFNSIVPKGALQGEVIPRYDLDQFFIPYELL